MLDNIADLLLMVGLLAAAFGFPTNIALRYMVPGTAIGVLAGDLLFFWLALKLAQKTGRADITAMPLGLDTPSTFGMVFFVLGPVFLIAKKTMNVEQAAIHTWHVGICAIFVSGLFKLACSVGSNWIRRLIPRAGLLGSLTAVALVLISFLPLLEILHLPLIGLVALACILTTLIARVELPFKIPGALGALLIAGGIFYAMQAVQSSAGFPEFLKLPGMDEMLTIPGSGEKLNPATALWPYEWLSAFRFQWLFALEESLLYLPVVIPFALATVVGGIDCTESAAAAGDDYDTRTVIAIEAVATLVASLCGGVIQTTPYIGHPAYKAMGGRAAYVLATAIFVGLAGLIGYVGYFYAYIPKPTVFPILIFVGLEITSQSFHATPRRHYPAVALACVPALAALAMMYVDKLRPYGLKLAGTPLEAEVQTLQILSSGFIVTSLLWASALASLIDRKLYRAASYYFAAAAFTTFGVIHSPLPGNQIFLPWKTVASGQLLQPYNHTFSEPFQQIAPYVAGYLAVALILVVWAVWLPFSGVKPVPPVADEV